MTTENQGGRGEKLSSDQRAILRVLQQADPDKGLLSGEIAERCPAKHLGRRHTSSYALPKLKALARRGLVVRHRGDIQRWLITPAAGLEVARPEEHDFGPSPLRRHNAVLQGC